MVHDPVLSCSEPTSGPRPMRWEPLHQIVVLGSIDGNCTMSSKMLNLYILFPSPTPISVLWIRARRQTTSKSYRTKVT